MMTTIECLERSIVAAAIGVGTVEVLGKDMASSVRNVMEWFCQKSCGN